MEQIEIENYRTHINSEGIGFVYAIFNGNEEMIGTVGNCRGVDAGEVRNRALQLLKANDFVIKTPEPKKASKVTLGLASDYDKVTLKLATEPELTTVYYLYLKGTDKGVFRINEKGIYVTKSKKIKLVAFTKEDINAIKNIDMFDVKKEKIKARWIKNKIATAKKA